MIMCVAAWLCSDSDERKGLNSELNVKGLLAVRSLLYRHQTHHAVDWCDSQQDIVLIDRLQSDCVGCAGNELTA